MHHLIFILLIINRIWCQQIENQANVNDAIDESSVNEFRGFFKKEHSLGKPYQGAGMVVPYWDIVGSTIVSSQHVKLTGDIQSKQGGLWNNVPVYSRDWELQIGFKVHGSTGELFGDGMAIWYVQERGKLGPVFGSKDYFRGLGIFLDTYSNHNGPHTHGHPYISAMVNNGTLHYDHDRDGTHTQLGGEHVGCEVKFRNKDFDTQVLVRYAGDVLSVFTDVLASGIWMKCLEVNDVQLPTGYYFGVSAATGELSDNHDVIFVKMFEQELKYSDDQKEGDRLSIEPRAAFAASPRDHVDSPRPSKLSWLGTGFLLLLAVGIIVLVFGFGILFWQKRQEMTRKRFY